MMREAKEKKEHSAPQKKNTKRTAHAISVALQKTKEHTAPKNNTKEQMTPIKPAKYMIAHPFSAEQQYIRKQDALPTYDQKKAKRNHPQQHRA